MKTSVRLSAPRVKVIGWVNIFTQLKRACYLKPDQTQFMFLTYIEYRNIISMLTRQIGTVSRIVCVETKSRCRAVRKQHT